MSVSKRTFRMFVEEELGEFPHFVVGAMLEWLLIASLFIDRFLAFMSNKFAMMFELDPPCVLCTRIDQSLVGNNPSTFYNNSICESHKKDISSLAYCHVHRKLSDIRNMCEACLLSFATDKEADFDEIKKPVEQKDTVAPKDQQKDDDNNMSTPKNLKPVKTKATNENNGGGSKDGEMMSKCCCCGEPFTTRTPSKAFVRTPAHLHGTSVLTPRAPLTPMGWRNDDAKNMELPHARYVPPNFTSDNEVDAAKDNKGSNKESKGKEEMKSASNPLLPDSDELNDESLKTPKGNKFFGVPLAEVIVNSPRFANKLLPKKLPLEKLDFLSDDEGPEEGDSISIVHHLKKQVRADRKILTDLYQELNEERSASAVAANNSMAMITRLQTEKASIEMEALQYQRMMEEQAEYDQEAIQILKDMLIQKEKDIKMMEKELQIYKEKFGEINKEDIERFARDRDDFESERFHLSGMLNNLENLIHSNTDDTGVSYDKDIEEEKKASLEREMSLIKERMSVMESDSGYLKHTGMALQKGDERADLLTEIAQNLRKLRT
ncbi:probable myosin-binding protein 5 [Lactuca sativa]|uniref:GTD-binding domain-containing protein n=1 Tax=Lactuca sativa TaxID=4236 RepID=A0A9R1XD66_LACSA|nr:probable myosin-binding protein 5 [Lactuca sativa]KAJ0208119.1 hypothetical protein LSAT_V11C500235360 [Lactuca sativa]